ncbi:hypothetical protein ACHAWF_007223 [Thalassiosira exigua]
MATEKDGIPSPREGRSGRGRGSRGCGGGRVGGRSAAAPGGGRCGGQRTRAAGRGGNHGRHPRQPSKSPHASKAKQNQGGRGRGRSRSSSFNENADGRCSVKKSGPYAHLFCSDRHAFGLSRVLYPVNNDQFLLPSLHEDEGSTRHRLASDEQFEEWWGSVKIVRCHLPFSDVDSTSLTDSKQISSLERCPICLDEEMVSPFIAPCGHSFCLTCVLGYLDSVAKDLNDESDMINKSKVNVTGKNSGVVGGTDLKGSVAITSVRARCPMCSSGSSMVLKAGDAMITYKDLRPVMFVPTLALNAATPGESKGGKGNKGGSRDGKRPPQGSRIRLVKMHRVKSCPSAYRPLDGCRIRGASTPATPEQRLPDLPDGDDDSEECSFTRQYFVGLDEYESILSSFKDDLNDYRQNSVHCKFDAREDWNVAMAIEAVQAAQRRWLGGLNEQGGFRSLEMEAKSAFISSMVEQKLLRQTNQTTCCGDGETAPKNTSLLQPGTFYLRQPDLSSSQVDPDEYLYYQSSDGQPCFLTGIDIACLMHEFSLHQPPEDTAADEGQCADAGTDGKSHQRPITAHKPRSKLPLPDEITGTVVEIERLPITPALIKRKHFLSHIPLNSNVSFVEIDWYSGGEGMNRPMLSHSTLTKFRSELQRRKSERLRSAKREQKADKAAKARSDKEEQRRRREFIGNDFVHEGTQKIDPDDEFFQAPAASFEEREEGAQWNRPATFQFNEVCATGGTWPELPPSLQSSGHRGPANNADSYALAPVAASPIWGSRKLKQSPVKAATDNFPSLSESAHSSPKHQSKGSKRGPRGHRG